ncbi:MAG: hypothetical protein GWN07_00280, partial [Actinobacteria bacterium]|nr:hypothetical protein [Actinomycetota bacterium]NIS28483.1 hypothetical protein [Actinomycetota bacterium]NIU63958.1 hypothetical protein [Actinomycetota bacterium]NIW25755.1 hypothetical protein [Actinomycetota bacterium]NIX18367.1 hypothetical protein [Actinomycetota bacterium]
RARRGFGGTRTGVSVEAAVVVRHGDAECDIIVEAADEQVTVADLLEALDVPAAGPVTIDGVAVATTQRL